jgi:hypothetical protein
LAIGAETVAPVRCIDLTKLGFGQAEESDGHDYVGTLGIGTLRFSRYFDRMGGFG